jgi:hypothetical protein
MEAYADRIIGVVAITRLAGLLWDVGTVAPPSATVVPALSVKPRALHAAAIASGGEQYIPLCLVDTLAPERSIEEQSSVGNLRIQGVGLSARRSF